MKKILFGFLLFASHFCAFGQITALSDEFESTCSIYDWSSVNVVEGWNASHLEQHDINVSNEGQMTMMPYTTAWFANYRSNLIFKEASGDFVFSAQVDASNRAENDIPGSLYSLAGIMIRSPKTMTMGLPEWNPGQENYIFLSLGFAATNHSTCQGCPGPHFEVKNTINSNSNLRVAAIDTASAIIRMVRKDDDVIVMYQLPNQPWQVHERYERSDLPDTVQIGFVTYSDWAKVSTYSYAFHNSNTLSQSSSGSNGTNNPGLNFAPDLIGKFSYARFDSINLNPAQNILDLSDPSEVSDLDMVNWFGYTTTHTKYQGWKIWKGVNSNWYNASNWSGNSIPSAQDSILIPDCSCAEVTFPQIGSGTISYPALLVENGASLELAAGVHMTIDIAAPNSIFENQGSIQINGTLVVSNALDKSVQNSGQIHCVGLGEYRVED